MEKCCAFYQWNWLAAMNTWKNLRFNFRLIAVVFCIWNLADRFWLKCSSKCILAITFKYLKHYWRTENENARSLNSCACVCRKSVLLILRITAKTQRLLHSWAILNFVEPTCLFESSHNLHLQCELCHLQLFFKLKAYVTIIPFSDHRWLKK